MDLFVLYMDIYSRQWIFTEELLDPNHWTLSFWTAKYLLESFLALLLSHFNLKRALLYRVVTKKQGRWTEESTQNSLHKALIQIKTSYFIQYVTIN